MYRILLILFLWCALMPFRATASNVDTVKMPAAIRNDFKAVTHFLCDSISSERGKVNAIYDWITTHIAYDVYGLRVGAVQSKDPNTILQKGSAVCEGYSILFTAMCSEAGIHTMNIVGYTKDWIFDKGDKLYIPRHMWSALLIDGRWLMSDATWGAGYIKRDTTWWRKLVHTVTGQPVHKTRKKFMWRYDNKWMFQDPEEFRYTHLPSYPPFQFTDTAMPLSVFEEGDSAIAAFNAISHPLNNNSELMNLAAVAEGDVLTEFPDAIYNFNNRFPLAAATGLNKRANEVLNGTADNDTATSYRSQVAEACSLMTQAREMVNKQSTISLADYAFLKKKNMQKYFDAMQYFRDLGALSRRSTSEIRRYEHISDYREESYAGMGQYYRRKALITDTTVPLPKRRVCDTCIHIYDSLYAVITDSINERKYRLTTVLNDETLLSHLQYYINDGNTQIPVLLTALETAQSLLINESYYRLYLQDNLDDGAGQCYNTMRKLMNTDIEVPHKYYIECFDSVMLHTRACFEIEKQRIDVYDDVLDDLIWLSGKYKADSSLLVTYTLWARYKIDCMQRIAATADAATAFINEFEKNVGKINEKYIYIARIAEGMQQLEKTRKDMEFKTILANEEMDMADINKFRNHVIKALAQLEAYRR